MKEKNKKTPTQDDTMPSKGKIIVAWFMLIVLLGCTTGLVYLKNFKPTKEETMEEETKTITPVIASVLNTIVDNFNKNTLVSDYKEEGLTLTANLTDDKITISYATTSTNGSISYNYDMTNFQLTTTFENTNKEINDKVFEVLVISCRQRVNPTDNISTELHEFITGTTEIPGLTKEVTDTNITYQIDIRYPLKEQEETTTSNTNTETKEEDTTTTQSSTSITSKTEIDDKTTNDNITTNQTITNSDNNTEDSNVENN